MGMSKVRAENRLTELELTTLARGLASRKKALKSMSAVAREAGLAQPFVSMAANRKLVAHTEQTSKLFEYLVSHGADDGHRAVAVDSDADIGEMLMRLTDGTAEGAERLRRLLKAIEAFKAVR